MKKKYVRFVNMYENYRTASRVASQSQNIQTSVRNYAIQQDRLQH